MATVSLPTPLRPYANKQSEVEVHGTTVGQALHHLTDQFPVLKKHLFSEDGSLRSFVNVYLNDEDIRFLEKHDTKLTQEDAISIIPSIAGGAP